MALGLSPVIALLPFALLVGVCTACSEPADWQVMSIASRAGLDAVDYVILGNVTATTPSRFIRRFGGNVYGAEVAVACVFKKPAQQRVYREIHVTGFGESNDCTTTEVRANLSYVFILSPFQSGYAVAEENGQLGAEAATDDNLRAMLSAFGCQEPSQPTTPPPTTTPLTTTPLPTTLPPSTTVTAAAASTTAAAVELTEPPAADESDDGTNGVGGLHLCCFLAVLALISSFVFV